MNLERCCGCSPHRCASWRWLIPLSRMCRRKSSVALMPLSVGISSFLSTMTVSGHTTRRRLACVLTRVSGRRVRCRRHDVARQTDGLRFAVLPFAGSVGSGPDVRGVADELHHRWIDGPPVDGWTRGRAVPNQHRLQTVPRRGQSSGGRQPGPDRSRVLGRRPSAAGGIRPLRAFRVPLMSLGMAVAQTGLLGCALAAAS